MPSFQNDEPLPNSGLMFPIKRVSFTRLWEATRPMYDLDRSTRVAMRHHHPEQTQGNKNPTGS